MSEWDELTAARLDDALRVVEAAARSAGADVLAGWRTAPNVEKKGAIDLLTEYDLQSERLLRGRLGEAFPTHRIVGEELEEERAEDDAPVWYVDPIDGTTNFVHGHFFFSVSIGLWHEGRAQLGVVHAPALGVTWAARRGAGCTRNGSPCRVGRRAHLADALCATGFPYDRWTNDDNNLPELEAFLKRVRGVRRCGSAAIDLALVADGTYDLYWEQRLSPWDLCAGAMLVEAAGGQLSDYDGGPPDARSGRLVASNGHVHAQALSVIDEARRGRSA